MKLDNETLDSSLGEISPFAIAIAGEQAKDWAYDQSSRFRPGGKNYNRLRALQAAGEALQEKPDLYAAAPELLEALSVAYKALEKSVHFQSELPYWRKDGEGYAAMLLSCEVLAKAKGQP
jgi:hypothetical protein